jgi:hypothetical protein
MSAISLLRQLNNLSHPLTKPYSWFSIALNSFNRGGVSYRREKSGQLGTLSRIFSSPTAHTVRRRNFCSFHPPSPVPVERGSAANNSAISMRREFRSHDALTPAIPFTPRYLDEDGDDSVIWSIVPSNIRRYFSSSYAWPPPKTCGSAVARIPCLPRDPRPQWRAGSYFGPH